MHPVIKPLLVHGIIPCRDSVVMYPAFLLQAILTCSDSIHVSCRPVTCRLTWSPNFTISFPQHDNLNLLFQYHSLDIMDLNLLHTSDTVMISSLPSMKENKHTRASSGRNSNISLTLARCHAHH